MVLCETSHCLIPVNQFPTLSKRIDIELLPIMAKADAMINEMHSVAEVAVFKYGVTLATKALAGVKTVK